MSFLLYTIAIMLSVVVPMYNESEGVDYFHYKLLLPAVKKASKKYEIIYVNDGSRDNTLELLQKIGEQDPFVKVVNLSRNFGKEIATTAGISAATGDATIIMDGDGQHPPELIEEFIRSWKDGAQVVVGIRKSNQGEGFVKRYGSKLFYKLINGLTEADVVPRSTDYRLIDAAVRTEFLRFDERNRITRGLIDWLGFKRDFIYFDSPERIAGEASYKTSQLIKLATNSFISLSLKPLFLFGWIGAGIIVLSVLFGLFTLIEQFILGDPLAIHFSGPVILGNFTAFMIGLVLVSQSMLAVYISHIHAQAQNRPLFVVDKKNSVNLD